jgi:glycosyltransferase involved in cell wall biosynthesis
VAFVTNLCPHYRVKTFETLAHYHNIEFYFYSAGDEWYWQQQHGVRSGRFNHQYLSGFHLGRSRVTASLIPKLLRGRYDMFIKCINGRFALPVTYVIARIRRKPFILWTGIWMRLQTTFHRLAFPLTRYIYRHADAVVVYGQHVKQYLMSEGVPPERIFVAHHAVDNDAYSRPVSAAAQQELRVRLGLAPDTHLLLYLGRLEENKGINYLLDAFARLSDRNAMLLIVGDGSERAALERQAERLGVVPRLRFCSYVAPEQTTVYYAMSYVLVLPSVTTANSRELWGLVVNEAMNQALPVIVTDAVGAVPGGLVQDGRNGFVVPERNADALQTAMEKILASPDLRDRMSRNARAAIKTWDNERMVEGFRAAIQFVCRDRRQAGST